jgi:quercetin dioxygenase-like cupin family protein
MSAAGAPERPCIHLAPGAGLAAGEVRDTLEASGRDLEILIRRFVQGEVLDIEAGAVGEEVMAVLEGEFHLSAAGEEYALSMGEGAIIPSAEARAWRCDSQRGVLYRAVVRQIAPEEGEA